MLRKCIAYKPASRKKNIKKNSLPLHSKQTQKEEKKNPKARMKGIIKIRAETSENSIKVAMSKLNKTKVVLSNINQDRSLATEIKGEKRGEGRVGGEESK